MFGGAAFLSLSHTYASEPFSATAAAAFLTTYSYDELVLVSYIVTSDTGRVGGCGSCVRSLVQSVYIYCIRALLGHDRGSLLRRQHGYARWLVWNIARKDPDDCKYSRGQEWAPARLVSAHHGLSDAHAPVIRSYCV